MNYKSYELFFEVFSNRTRMKIINSLLSGPKSVGEICSDTGEEQSKISHNLKKLMLCHFLDVERKGKNRIYHLNRATIKPMLRLVERHVKQYCRGRCTRK